MRVLGVLCVLVLAGCGVQQEKLEAAHQPSPYDAALCPPEGCPGGGGGGCDVTFPYGDWSASGAMNGALVLLVHWGSSYGNDKSYKASGTSEFSSWTPGSAPYSDTWTAASNHLNPGNIGNNFSLDACRSISWLSSGLVVELTSLPYFTGCFLTMTRASNGGYFSIDEFAGSCTTQSYSAEISGTQTVQLVTLSGNCPGTGYGIQFNGTLTADVVNSKNASNPPCELW